MSQEAKSGNPFAQIIILPLYSPNPTTKSPQRRGNTTALLLARSPAGSHAHQAPTATPWVILGRIVHAEHAAPRHRRRYPCLAPRPFRRRTVHMVKFFDGDPQYSCLVVVRDFHTSASGLMPTRWREEAGNGAWRWWLERKTRPAAAHEAEGRLDHH